MRTPTTRLIAPLFTSLLLACGGGGGGGGGGPDADPGAPDAAAGTSLFPMAVGASWTYRVSDLANNTTESKNQTVEAYEDVGGIKAGTMAFRLRTEKPGGKVTVSWQEDTPDAVIRHREQNFDALNQLVNEDFYTPYKLRVDETDAHTAASAAWDESYQEQNTDQTVAPPVTSTVDKVDHWVVVSADESVTVPAGTYTALHLHRTNNLTGSDKHYWFVPGIGKVKETGALEQEVLTSFSLP